MSEAIINFACIMVSLAVVLVMIPLGVRDEGNRMYWVQWTFYILTSIWIANVLSIWALNRYVI